MKERNAIEKLFELAEKQRGQRDAIAQEISDLKNREATLKAESLEAARSGNTELYLAKEEEKTKVSAEIFVKESYLDSLPSAVTRDQAIDAWMEFAAEYNPKLKKALDEFTKEKEKLCSMYDDIVEMQDDALQLREKLGRIVKTDYTVFRMDFIPVRTGVDQKGLMTLGGVIQTRDPDALYCLASWSIRTNRPIFNTTTGYNDDYVKKILSVVCSHKSSLNKQ